MVEAESGDIIARIDDRMYVEEFLIDDENRVFLVPKKMEKCQLTSTLLQKVIRVT